MDMQLWVGVLLLVAVALWAMAVYNRLVQLRNRTANAFGQIDVQLKRRHDLVPNLVEVARGYLQHEASTLQAVIAARGQAQGAASNARQHVGDAAALGALAAAEGVLGSSLGRLMVLTEAYPELKADATMQSLSEELNSTENRIGYARQSYNDQVLELNNAAKAFPAIVVASVLGFHAMPMLQSTQSVEERQAVRVQF